MEYGQIGRDGTGTHLDPQKLNFKEASAEATYKSQIAFWDLKRGADMAASQNFPGIGARDLLPHVGVGAPQEGYRSSHTPQVRDNSYYAVGNRADGMPLEVIEYSADRGGNLTYKQQYLLHYQDLPDGQNRVTVQNWMPNDGEHYGSPKAQIGNQENVLVNLSQYYRNGNETTKAEYWTAASITAKPEPQRKGAPPNGDGRTPDIRITFNDGVRDIKLQEKQISGLLGGGLNETGRQAQYDLQRVSPKYNFYDLFVPKS